VGKAEDGIHRRADLVAHVGQEFRFGPGRRLGPFLGRVQGRRGLAFIGDVLEHAHQSFAEVPGGQGLGRHPRPEAAAILTHELALGVK
jgi:hypothetical protein